MDFGAIARAGLTQKQFAKMVGTDRVTVNTWVKGKHAPKGPTRIRAHLALQVLQRAIERGELPITVHETRVDRFVASVASKLAPAPSTPKE